MLIHKILFFHTLGTLMISLCVAREIDWNYDLATEESSNRRIVHNAAEEQSLHRGKKHSPSTEKPSTAAPDDDEEKKTLAQQVADGKYGLIQTELFASPVKRPGIISYEINPEVPKDNVNNLGGLQPEEIWLAENHLLVIKGGGFRSQENQGKSSWPPIDNYIAPQRQVKIPPNPKVPPPFPVQLSDGGPIEFIRGINGSGGPPPFFDPRFGPPPFLPPNGQDGNFKGVLKPPGNFTEGNGRPPPFPFPGPGIGLFPPAVAFLPPPANFTELDEDDPSIYYPPPYDFVYEKENSSHVPAGPLVPGIILPPPPDFFAPYEKNKHQPTKSTSRKPTKTRPTQYIQQTISTKPRPPKPPKPTVIVKITSTTSTSTTPRPFTSTGRAPNDINPPPTLPPHTPVGDWVPIPAPRPFYITGLNSIKPSIDYEGLKTKYDLPKNGWVFSNTSNYDGIDNNKQQIVNPIIQNWSNQLKFNQEKRGRQYTTTETPLYTGFKPIFTSKSTTTTPPETNYVGNYGQVKANKEYYFYEEPQITEGKYIDSDSTRHDTTKPTTQQYYRYPNKNNYETNTLLPPQLYDQVSVKNPSESGRVQTPNIKYYGEQFVKPSIPSAEFYYYKEAEKENQGYSYDAPAGPPLNENYKAKRKNITKATTEKPPVYEYSYSAPGYGSIEAPKVGINYGTTPKSIVYESDFTPIKKHQFSFFDYQTTPKTITFKKEHTTARPQFYKNTAYDEYNLGLYKTPATYNVYHQEMGLLDDITKKYFTLFGQKLNSEGLNEPTTPLPPVQSLPKKQYYKQYSPSIESTTESKKQNVKFPDEMYEMQNDQQYFTKTEAETFSDYETEVQRPGFRQNQGYSNYYRLPSPEYQYDDYDAELVRPGHPLDSDVRDSGLVRPGHPLDSDVRVNYKTPSGRIHPDAEYIDPYYARPPSRPRGNSYISYQLPGTGGHFYFLTPQSVKPENYHLLNPRLRYPESENVGYFKRNVQTRNSRPRRMHSEQISRSPIK